METNVPIGLIMKLYIEDGQTYPAIKVLQDADPAPTGFSEITDIVQANKYGLGVIDRCISGWCDKLSFRTKMKEMIYTKMQVAAPADVDDQAKWDLLTAAEKKIAAELFVIGKESFFLEVNNDLRHWTLKAGEYRTWSMEARQQRSDLAESILFMRMANLSDAKQASADLSQIALDTVIDIDDVSKKVQSKVRVKRLNRQYVEGLEDEEHDGVVAVKDWINSKVGTPYENNGFMNLGYPFEGSHTAESVRDEMLAALDGLY